MLLTVFSHTYRVEASAPPLQPFVVARTRASPDGTEEVLMEIIGSSIETRELFLEVMARIRVIADRDPDLATALMESLAAIDVAS